MIEYLQYFFNPRHLFSVRPQAMEDTAALILLGIFIAFIIVGIAAQFIGNRYDHLTARGFEKIRNACVTIGGIGLVYLFFAWEGVALLGARFWLLILGFGFVIWLIPIVTYFKVSLPSKKMEIERQRSKSKYIP